MSANPPAAAAPASPPRLGYLDALRALAAAYVLLRHAWLTVMPGTADTPLLKAVGGALAAGHLAVSAFIVISGFSLGLTVTRHLQAGTRVEWGRWFARRARRIVPPFWAATALSVVLILTVIGEPTGTIWDVVLPFSWDQVVRTMLLTGDIRPAGVNHVFWSIAVEWHLYLWFPLLVWLLRRRDPVTVAVLAVAAGTALQVAASEVTLGGMTLQYLGLFAMGAAAARWVADGPAPRRGLGVVAVLLLGAGLFLGWRHGLDNTSVLATDPVFGVGVAALLLHLRLADRSRLRAALAHPLLERAGLMSYTTYLVHAPLLQVCWQVAVRPLDLGVLPSLGVLLAVALPVVYVGGYAFHVVVERPFMSGGTRPPALPVPRPRVAAEDVPAAGPPVGAAV